MTRAKITVVIAVAALLVLSGGPRALAGEDVLLDKKDKLTDDDKGYKPGKGTDKIEVKFAKEIFKVITGAKHKLYTVKLKKGDKVVIEMHSTDVDSVVVVEDAKMNVLGLNDDDPDGGGTLDSRLQWTAPADGQYRVIATNLTNKTGDFTLKVTRSGGARPKAGGGALLDKKDKLTDDDKGYKPGKGIDKIDVPFAEQIFKAITDAKHKVYTVKLKKGEKVVIEMHSDDLDSVVVVEDAKMNVLALNDDDPDGGGTLDSRLQWTAPADGQYRIIATNLRKKTGDFTLKVTTAK